MIFILKKVLNPFLSPPGIIVIFLIVSGVWLLSRRYLKAGFINLITGILLWILSISPVSDALLQGLESELKIPVEPQGDVIILLGGGSRDKAPDLSGIGAPGGDTMIRIVTVVRLQKRLDVPILVSSGRISLKKPAPQSMNIWVFFSIRTPTKSSLVLRIPFQEKPLFFAIQETLLFKEVFQEALFVDI